MFLCLLILLNLLCLGSPFHRLQFHSSCCFWCLPPVGKVGSVDCVGFLVEGTRASVGGWGWILLVGRTMFGGVFWGVCELIMILCSLSANGWGCVPVLLVVWHRVSSSVTCWSLSGAVSYCWDGDVWESFRHFIFTWDEEVSAGPVSWTRLSNLKDSGLTPGYSTMTLLARLRRKGWKRKKERKREREKGRKGGREERK